MGKHICGPCGAEFEKEQDYLNHTCEVSGVRPTNPENLGEGFSAISEAALERGAAKAAKEEEK